MWPTDVSEEDERRIMALELLIEGQEPVIIYTDPTKDTVRGLVPGQKYTIIAAHGYYPRRRWLWKLWHRVVRR